MCRGLTRWHITSGHATRPLSTYASAGPIANMRPPPGIPSHGGHLALAVPRRHEQHQLLNLPAADTGELPLDTDQVVPIPGIRGRDRTQPVLKWCVPRAA